MEGENGPEPGFEALIRHIGESRGIDFGGYKPDSLRRRLRQRMQQAGCDDFAAYQALLEADPGEFVRLLDTVLINVTTFFRDPEAWEVIRRDVIPAILGRAAAEDRPIRVWSAGCASGEEAYGLAMLFAEAMGVEAFQRRVKLYATDLDEDALRAARLGAYDDRALESVPPALLERYFERSGSHRVVGRELRKGLIFGRHNVVRDAPISRIDLLACRNLLIYLQSETQRAVLGRMHYALAEEGVLFLGRAETQLASSTLFAPLDLRHRIFRKLTRPGRAALPGAAGEAAAPRPDNDALRARVLAALAEHADTAFLAVDEAGLLAFANPAALRLLGVGEADLGRPFRDLPISYRPAELRSRIDDAQAHGRAARLEHQNHHRPPADPVRLTIEVTPLAGADNQRFATLVSFTDTTQVFILQHDLAAAQETLATTVEELQSANEELETTNEELQSSNEELETTNEELQSTNEELETMNEELRSSNEELAALNDRLRQREGEADTYRRHAEAVLRSVDAGMVVVDEAARVRSWNRWCENTLGLRAEEVLGERLLGLDVGLPLATLRPELERVLAGAAPSAERILEGRDRRGQPLRARIRLSLAAPGHEAPPGAVLVMEDFSGPARAEDLDRQLGRLVGQALGEACALDPATLRFMLAGRGAEARLGHPLAQLRAMSLDELLADPSPERLRAELAPLFSGERPALTLRAVLRARGGREEVEVFVRHLADEAPPVLLVLLRDADGPSPSAGPGAEP